MHAAQVDVEQFHRALAIPVGTVAGVRRPALRASLIFEEAQETVTAIRRADILSAIDGMVDLMYVIYGTAVEWGIDLAPFWDEVHRANMAKQGGPLRPDGKQLKPDGWAPPDIAGIYTSLYEAT